MATTATQATTRMAFTLPGTLSSVQLARSCTRAVLTGHDLGPLADDAELVTSELVTNAIAHTNPSTLRLEVMYLPGRRAIAVIVTDPSPQPPIKRAPDDDTENGRGLAIVEALSTRWGCRPQHPGKAVYAILTPQA